MLLNTKYLFIYLFVCLFVCVFSCLFIKNIFQDQFCGTRKDGRSIGKFDSMDSKTNWESFINACDEVGFSRVNFTVSGCVINT